MKPNIHPKYEETTIKCACGNEVKTRCGVSNLHVEICSACHPFYTKQSRNINTTGRVERFNKKYSIKK